MEKQPAPLPEEKKKAILEASIKEFAEKGYVNASTNTIIRGAGISKGLLFHYFGSKKNLYLLALDACVAYYVQYLSESLKALPPDLFERILALSNIKIKLFLETPLMYRMVATAFIDVPPELKEEVLARQNKLASEQIPIFLSGIDGSLFREDINQNKAIGLVMTTMEALSQKYTSGFRESQDKGLQDMPNILEELKDYIDILKYGVYKNPEERTGSQT